MCLLRGRLSCVARAGHITFRQFEMWYIEQLKGDVRAARHHARTLFADADEDASRSLNRSELKNVVRQLQIRFPAILLDPPFELERDYLEMTAHQQHDKLTSEGKDEVCWDEFEKWWRARSGDNEGTVPVLPEGMTDQANRLVSWGNGRAHMQLEQGLGSVISRHEADYVPEGSSLDDARLTGWAFLRPRLMMLIDLQAVWGDIGSMYESAATVLSENVASNKVRKTRRCLKNPDSWPTWDYIHVVCIIYVLIVVPLRVGFDEDVEPMTPFFFVELSIDIFFILDLLVCFRTAYIHEDGVLQDDPCKIALRYLRGWFVVDFLSAFPLSYLQLAFKADDDGPDGNTKTWKMVRMLRLLKMMKVQAGMNLVRKLDKEGKFTDWMVAMSSFFTFLCIAYASHLLACFWFFSGNTNELGWVQRYMTSNTTVCPLCPKIKLANKYVHSMYTAFKLGDVFAVSAAEKTFAVFSEGVIMVIAGALAGMMSQMMIASRLGEQEYVVKLAKLKAWIRARQFSRPMSARIMRHFIAANRNTTSFEEAQCLKYLPVSFARELSLEMYGDLLTMSPLFRLLGKELILQLCQLCKPVTISKSQTVFKKGDVGHEMYFVVRGEMEVTTGEVGNQHRLGFIGHGGFFGEHAVIHAMGRKLGTGGGLRIRTICASCESDLIALTTDLVLQLCDRYPELEIRLNSFRRAGQRLNPKGREKRNVENIFRTLAQQGADWEEHKATTTDVEGSVRQIDVHRISFRNKLRNALTVTTSKPRLRTNSATLVHTTTNSAKVDDAASALLAQEGGDLAAAMQKLLSTHQQEQSAPVISTVRNLHGGAGVDHTDDATLTPQQPTSQRPTPTPTPSYARHRQRSEPQP